MLGGSNSFSGPLAFTGEQATKFGVDLYFKVVNDAGGIHGRKVRTVYYDDGYRPQDAVANTRKLVEQDGIFAVIAPQGTPPVVATIDYLEENKVPLLFPFQGSPVTRGQQVRVQRHDALRPAVEDDDRLPGRARGSSRPSRALYQDDEYGKAFLTAFEKDLGPPQPQAGRRRAGQARRHRRERADRQAAGGQAAGDVPRAHAAGRAPRRSRSGRRSAGPTP